MVTDLSDLEAHNPNSATNDSLWETNYLADTDDEIDSSNAAMNTTMQQGSNQATNNQHQLWNPPEGSNVKLVELEEGLCGLTNAELVFMDWETSCSSYQRVVRGDFPSYDFGVIYAESPETNMAKTSPEVPKFSNFEVGESSGTTPNNEDTKVIGGTLTCMMPREDQHENISSHNFTNWYGDNIVGNMELNIYMGELSPQLAILTLLSFCCKTQRPAFLLNHLQGLIQQFMQENGLSVRQPSDPRIHSIAALPNQHAGPKVIMYDSSSSFNKLQNQKPKKSSPKRQRCEEAHVMSSPRRRRIDQHQWIPGTKTQWVSYNQAEDLSTVIATLQCSGIENNELIIRIIIPDNPSQHREPNFSWNRPTSQQSQTSLMLSHILHLLSNLGLSEVAHERPPKQP